MPAIVITIAQQKGGAGKTTLAAHLALTLAAQRRVAVIDIDPQASLATWFRPEPVSSLYCLRPTLWRS